MGKWLPNGRYHVQYEEKHKHEWDEPLIDIIESFPYCADAAATRHCKTCGKVQTTTTFAPVWPDEA